MKTAIVGGGAAGFFCAVNLKEMMPQMQVCIFEASHRVLAKVEISGGGRCNCTNSFAAVGDLKTVYPRGSRLMGRLFRVFSPQDAYEWFERHGVPLTTQEDECVFPVSQDAHSIMDCLTGEARRLGVTVKTGSRIRSLEELEDYDFVVVTTGGQPRAEGLHWLAEAGHKTEPPVPSLFTFNIADASLRALMGTVVEGVSVYFPGTKLRASGALLVTHWGMSGPAILKLSSYAARWLCEHDYRQPLCVNWTGRTEAEVSEALHAMATTHRMKQLASQRPFDLPGRLWTHLLDRCLGERASLRWADIGKKDLNRLTNTLIGDCYEVSGKGAARDEFVTCGGISLESVSPQTLESRHQPHLFFAGEVLDIDGITGGFNFQAAWTTSYVVAKAISSQSCNQG